jgi:hypothetical protein
VTSPEGAVSRLSSLSVGQFATLDVNSSTPCVSQVSVLAAPHPPACKAVDFGGAATVRWVGFNQSAQSVVYTATGPNEPTVALHWCTTPVVAGANGAAISLPQIPAGASVQLTLSQNDWVTAVSVQP